MVKLDLTKVDTAFAALAGEAFLTGLRDASSGQKRKDRITLTKEIFRNMVVANLNCEKTLWQVYSLGYETVLERQAQKRLQAQISQQDLSGVASRNRTK